MATRKKKKDPTSVRVDPQDPSEIAAGILVNKLEAEAADRLADLRAQQEKYVWAMGCLRDQRHLGIFLAVNPEHVQTFHPGLWYTTYHSNNQRWLPGPTALGEIVCDQCLSEGAGKVNLPITYAGESEAGACFRVIDAHRRGKNSFFHRITRAAEPEPEPEPEESAPKRELQEAKASLPEGREVAAEDSARTSRLFQREGGA